MAVPMFVHAGGLYPYAPGCPNRHSRHGLRDSPTLAVVILQPLYLIVVLIVSCLWVFFDRRSKESFRRPLRWCNFGLALFLTVVDYGMGLGFTVANGCYAVRTYSHHWIALAVASGWIHSVAIIFIWGTAIIPVAKALLSFSSRRAASARLVVSAHYGGIALVTIFAAVANSLQTAQAFGTGNWRLLDVYQGRYVDGVLLDIVWQTILTFLALGFGGLATATLWRSRTNLKFFLALLTLCLLGWALDALIENAYFRLQDSHYVSRNPASIVVSSAFAGLFQTLALVFLLFIGVHPAMRDMPPIYEGSSMHQEPGVNADVELNEYNYAVDNLAPAELAEKDNDVDAKLGQWEDEKDLKQDLKRDFEQDFKQDFKLGSTREV